MHDISSFLYYNLQQITTSAKIVENEDTSMHFAQFWPLSSLEKFVI